MLKKEDGDGILFGASRLEHVQQNLIDLDKGPLRDGEVVTVVNEGWESAKPYASEYMKYYVMILDAVELRSKTSLRFLIGTGDFFHSFKRNSSR
ncbi:hypothetical protein BDP27DRAFT_1337082 [Rhodocollybia butyracea]|uniref:Uncharacterized protein n=1 Tax=Rhodocollybia butyracea TaxID=206335 RepID=A0A9P5PF39_9AGAR|nr:hypothetical protein BDP27DRAFT_1337082 [Rhodocollybia butyracea]